MSTEIENQDQAMQEIQGLKKDIKEKEEKEKSASLIGYMLTAYILSAVGFFLAIFLGRTIADMPEETMVMMEGTGGGLIGTMIQVGWVVGGASLGVGLLLTIFFITDKIKKRKKPEEKDNQEETNPEKPKENLGSELDSLNQRIE